MREREKENRVFITLAILVERRQIDNRNTLKKCLTIWKLRDYTRFSKNILYATMELYDQGEE